MSGAFPFVLAYHLSTQPVGITWKGVMVLYTLRLRLDRRVHLHFLLRVILSPSIHMHHAKHLVSSLNRFR